MPLEKPQKDKGDDTNPVKTPEEIIKFRESLKNEVEEEDLENELEENLKRIERPGTPGN